MTTNLEDLIQYWKDFTDYQSDRVTTIVELEAVVKDTVVYLEEYQKWYHSTKEEK